MVHSSSRSWPQELPWGSLTCGPESRRGYSLAQRPSSSRTPPIGRPCGWAKTRPSTRTEYDFRSLKGGVRGKYYRRFRAGTNIVRIEPDLARAFPTDEAVNEALRTVVRAARASRSSTRLPNNAMRLTRGGRKRA